MFFQVLKLRVQKENEWQTSSCVWNGSKKTNQDFGYLMKILSLGSFPTRCQSGRRINVWNLCVCVCERVSPGQVSPRLFSYRGHTNLNLWGSALADSRPSGSGRVDDIGYIHSLQGGGLSWESEDKEGRQVRDARRQSHGSELRRVQNVFCRASLTLNNTLNVFSCQSRLIIRLLYYYYACRADDLTNNKH